MVNIKDVLSALYIISRITLLSPFKYDNKEIILITSKWINRIQILFGSFIFIINIVVNLIISGLNVNTANSLSVGVLAVILQINVLSMGVPMFMVLRKSKEIIWLVNEMKRIYRITINLNNGDCCKLNIFLMSFIIKFSFEYIVIVILIIFMLSTLILDEFKDYTYSAVIIPILAYPFTTPIIFTAQLYLCLWFFVFILTKINSYLYYLCWMLNHNWDTISYDREFLTSIETLIKIHSELVHLTRAVNKIFKVQFTFMLLNTFSNVTCQLFFIYIRFTNNYDLTRNFNFITVFIILTFVICRISEIVLILNSTEKILHKVRIKYQLIFLDLSVFLL